MSHKCVGTRRCWLSSLYCAYRPKCCLSGYMGARTAPLGKGCAPRLTLQCSPASCAQMLPPCGYTGQPATCYATKFVHVSVNKVRAPMCSSTACVHTPAGYICHSAGVHVQVLLVHQDRWIEEACHWTVKHRSRIAWTCRASGQSRADDARRRPRRSAAASTWRCGRQRGGAA